MTEVPVDFLTEGDILKRTDYIAEANIQLVMFLLWRFGNRREPVPLTHPRLGCRSQSDDKAGRGGASIPPATHSMLLYDRIPWHLWRYLHSNSKLPCKLSSPLTEQNWITTKCEAIGSFLACAPIPNDSPFRHFLFLSGRVHVSRSTVAR